MYGKIDVSHLRIDPIERRARLGVASDAPEDKERECEARLRECADGAFCATRVPVSNKNGVICLGDEMVESSALCKLLDGCEGAYLITVTLGYGVDRLLGSLVTEAYLGYLTDALADCLIEAATDEAEKLLECKERLTKRFSPGYSDLPLEFGRRIVVLSGADKLLGIRFTESGLMSPKKSINAVIGIRCRDVR